jgi:2-amino-4-hydroxy-6-hydroxymethyldihydropteridine diphosphokinase
MTNTYLIAIGSNFEAEKNINQVLSELTLLFGEFKKTRIIKTEPIGMTNNLLFSNGLICISSGKDIEEISLILKNIEKKLGRSEAGKQKGIIPIDIDIIKQNNNVLSEDFEREYIKQLFCELFEK